MTRKEARAALAEIWRFNQVSGLIELREVTLIKAVQGFEASRAVRPPNTSLHAEIQAPNSA